MTTSPTDNGPHSRRLVSYLAALSARHLPDDLVEKAQTCLMDTLGVGLFGAIQPWSRILAENTLAEGARGPCTLLARGETMAPAPVGLVNGTAMHGFELDDLIAQANAHPGAIAVPAALAAAEHADASGERLLLGVIAGYEAMARVGYALGPETSRRGFHVTGVAGPVAAAVAAGVTLGMSAELILGAVGLACSAASGLKSFARGDGGVVKRMHAGHSVEAGIRACLLAQRGFTGPRTAIDGKFGLLEVFGGGGAQPAKLVEALGERWVMDDVWVKVYPVCGQIQGTVQLLMGLRGPRPLPAEDIKKVRVGVCGYAISNNGNPAPTDIMGAQYSIPYCAALASVGDPLDADSFSDRALARSDLREVAKRVEIVADPQADALYPEQIASRVELHLAGGAVLTASALNAHGSPADPCSQAEKEAKFSRLAAVVMAPGAVEQLADTLRRVQSLASIAPLSRALRAAGAASRL